MHFWFCVWKAKKRNAGDGVPYVILRAWRTIRAAGAGMTLIRRFAPPSPRGRLWRCALQRGAKKIPGDGDLFYMFNVYMQPQGRSNFFVRMNFETSSPFSM